MPESKGRDKKAAVTPPPAKRPQKVKTGNAAWFVPVMLGLMILGLLWVVTFYITQQQYPIPALERWNLLVGFALMLTGFAMTTRWK